MKQKILIVVINTGQQNGFKSVYFYVDRKAY